MTPDLHDCPVDGCAERVPVTLLMCRRHWGMVPPELGRRLYRAYNRGDGQGTPEHIAAMAECIAYVNERIAK